MTTVRFYCCKDGTLVGVSACGHSDYADEGSDIVCAGVTVSMNMAADYLKALAGAGVTVTVNSKPAIRVSVASNNPIIRWRCSVYLKSMRRVMQESFGEYGEFIQIRNVPWRGDRKNKL